MTTMTTVTKSERSSTHDDGRDRLAWYVNALRTEGERFAAVSGAGDLDVPIAACPGWTMANLVEHVGLVHLWAAANVAVPSDRWITVKRASDLDAYWPGHTTIPTETPDLLAWYRSTVATLVNVLETTPFDHRCLTFLEAPTPLIMWARRQASEVAVHRIDAELARGCVTGVDAELAGDMLDELLVGFGSKMRTTDVDRDHVLHVVADDIDCQFTVAVGPDGVRVGGNPERSGLRVSGTASELCLLLWNRPRGASIRLEGDERALEVWQRACRIEWR